MIKFNEELHQYTDEDNNVFISTTQFISKFYKHFDEVEDFWLLYKAVQYTSDIDKPVKIKKYSFELDLEINLNLFSSREYTQLIRYALSQCNKSVLEFEKAFTKYQLDLLKGVTVKIKNHWIFLNKKSTTKGTLFHNWKENKQFSEGKYEYNGDFYKVVERERTKLADLPVGVHPEVRMWNKHYRLAGTADQVIVLPGKKVVVRDWKTNIELRISNDYGDKMLAPVDHLDDCNLNHYNLQLSIYGWMLEQFGYEVIGLEIEHYTLEEEGINWKIVEMEKYPMNYLKKDVINMLKYGI